MRNLFKPPPAPAAFGAGKVLPERDASLFSRLIFHWLSPFLNVGFSRPLEQDDLWSLPNDRLAAVITDQVELNFFSRCEPGTRPLLFQEPESNPSSSGKVNEQSEDANVNDEKFMPSESEPHAQTQRRRWFSKGSDRQKITYDASLVRALHRTFFLRIWVAGMLNLASDTLKTTTPLLTKVILNWLVNSYVYNRLSDQEKASGIIPKPKGVGYGIGLAFCLFVMQEAASLMTNHYMQTGMTTGLYIRTGLIGNIFRKSLRLSGRARLEHSVGQITTMISTDATRLDEFSTYAHQLWVSPIQIVLGIGLLIQTLGYSALVGLGVMIFGFPVQMVLVIIMIKQRQKGVEITDTRVRLTTEILQGIRLLKFYAWEPFYINQIVKLRTREVATIRTSAIAQSGLIASVGFIPVLSAILSFITYALSGHNLNVAVIFSSLQLFNIIRTPLIMLPLVLSSLSNALVAANRISKLLAAEELAEPYLIDDSLEAAVIVDGDFTWEKAGNSAGSDVGPGAGQVKENACKTDKKKEVKQEQTKPILPTTATEVLENQAPAEGSQHDDNPFELKKLKMNIPKGSFVAIVGQIGSGKSSVLQSLIGEMRRTRGQVVFGGTVAYVPQSSWMRNATLRENVIFGQRDDEKKFSEVIRACRLERDLDMLPHREQTEIGEKGINLSGGQKARVSLARAAYSEADIVLLDDPISAVDAYVGRAILDECLLTGPLANRTRILVTHALHVLHKTDYIYVMDNGVITEEGTYQTLLKDSVVFASLMEEYGRAEQQADHKDLRKAQAKVTAEIYGSVDNNIINATLMQAEERHTGAVPWSVYKKYLTYAGGIAWAPIIIGLLLLDEAARVGYNLFLGFWTSGSVHGFRQGDYMAVYAGLGIADALFSFLLSFSFYAMCLIASLRVFKAALSGVLRSPTAFFDTTPMGRILSRLSKDQDTLDSELAITLWAFLSTSGSVLGIIVLVFYTFPYLGIIFVPMTVLYYLSAAYYRRSSVETKRLDALLRSTLYGSYSETLTGLSTIRAYRQQSISVKRAEHGLDQENRAYYMTISISRWFSVRLDFFGNLLILGIALFAAGLRHSVNPAKIGVVLSYTLGITQSFSEMISQFAKNEQNMNAVERVLHYTELPAEGAVTTSNDPPMSWPDRGQISFTNVAMAYREGLPLVLKNVTFGVKPGEKVGIVGRTGAGKSSLLQALFRAVELHNGKIEIDGYDISCIGLDVLRGRLALVPQDNILFLGTLRENLDPQNLRTDAGLISLLQRAQLLPRDSPDPTAEKKFSLDSTVSDEGSNFSAGEKQLLALCRALVKDSRIIVLDEPTSNVDVETDAKLQRTIQTEFASSTLLCIAHRLNTIAYYDRVLVMDAGEIAEFDTVLNLYDNEASIFRSLCNEANLQRADILHIRADQSGTPTSLN